MSPEFYPHRGAGVTDSDDTKAERYMLKKDMTIAGFDPELAAAIAGEMQRQEEHIELIASENYT